MPSGGPIASKFQHYNNEVIPEMCIVKMMWLLCNQCPEWTKHFTAPSERSRKYSLGYINAIWENILPDDWASEKRNLYLFTL